jgi:hypothetical protein
MPNLLCTERENIVNGSLELREVGTREVGTLRHHGSVNAHDFFRKSVASIDMTVSLQKYNQSRMQRSYGRYKRDCFFARGGDQCDCS